MKMINFEKKKMIPLTKQWEFYEKTKICYICKKYLKMNALMIKINVKLNYYHYAGKYRGADM